MTSFVYSFTLTIDGRDPVIPYWSRLYALQTGLKLSSKLPEETALFIGMIKASYSP